LIIAAGVQPNINLAKKAEIKTAKGIIVNEYMQTSVKDVYTACDCVEPVDMLLMKAKFSLYELTLQIREKLWVLIWLEQK
jgi:nitrite reductase (NADH) large subunit